MNLPCVLGGNDARVSTGQLWIESESELHYLVIMSIVLCGGDLEYFTLHISKVQTDLMSLGYVSLYE